MTAYIKCNTIQIFCCNNNNDFACISVKKKNLKWLNDLVKFFRTKIVKITIE